MGTLAFNNGGNLSFSGSGDRVLNAPNLNFAFTDLNLPSGSLTLQSGGLTFNSTSNGATTIPTGATLNLEGGTLTNNGPLNVSGSFGLFGGTLGGAGAINLTGGVIDMPTTSSVSWTATGPMANSGTLNLSNRTITNPLTNTGTINSGGGLSFSQPFTNQGTFNATAGITTFSGGFNQTAGSLTLNGGNLTGDIAMNGGVLAGTGSITGNVTFGAATLAPGFSPGTINILGNLTLGSASITAIQLWGATPGTGFDVINVSGTASLNGALNASIGNGYVPLVNASHVFLTAGNITGSFTNNIPTGFGLASTSTALDLLNGSVVAPYVAPPSVLPLSAAPLTTPTLQITIDQSINQTVVSVATPTQYIIQDNSLLSGSMIANLPPTGAGVSLDLTTLNAATVTQVNNLINELVYDAKSGGWKDENEIRLVCR